MRKTLIENKIVLRVIKVRKLDLINIQIDFGHNILFSCYLFINNLNNTIFVFMDRLGYKCFSFIT